MANPWPAPPPPYARQATGIDALLGGTNDWLRNNSGLLQGIGAGLLSGDLTQLSQTIPAGIALQKEEAEKRKADAILESQQNYTLERFAKEAPDLLDAVKGGVPVAQAWSAFLDRKNGKATALPASVQEYQFAKDNGFAGSYAEWMQTGRNGSAGPQLGMTPQWAMDPATGKYVLGQMSSTGVFTPTDMGGLEAVDPFAAAGGKAGAVGDAKTQAAARQALPGAEVAAEQTLKAIEIIRNDTAGATDQFGNTMGVPNRNIPGHPDWSPRNNWQANFTSAQAGAFMAARQALKGGGQITDFEGAKAEAAYSRMQQAVERGDKANFDMALADFEEAVKLGLQKLRETANGAYAAGQPNVTGAPPAAASTGDPELDAALAQYGG